MSALEKLKEYLNKLNRIGILDYVDKYVKFCMSFYLESSLTELTPEQLNTGEYCLPEREVSHWFSDQWEQTLRKQNSAVTDGRQEGEPKDKTEDDAEERKKVDEVAPAIMSDAKSKGRNTEIEKANEKENKSEVGNNTMITPVSNEPDINKPVKNATENMFTNDNIGKDILKEKVEVEKPKKKLKIMNSG